MLVCTCGGCGRVWPGARWGQRGLTVRPWIDLAVSLAIAWLIAWIVVRSSEVCEENLLRYGLGTSDFLRSRPQPTLHYRLDRLFNSFSVDYWWDSWPVFLRFGAAALAALWSLLRPARRPFLSTLVSLWVFTMALQVFWAVTHHRASPAYLDRVSAVQIFDDSFQASLLNTTITLAFALPAVALSRSARVRHQRGVRRRFARLRARAQRRNQT